MAALLHLRRARVDDRAAAVPNSRPALPRSRSGSRAGASAQIPWDVDGCHRRRGKHLAIPPTRRHRQTACADPHGHAKCAAACRSADRRIRFRRRKRMALTLNTATSPTMLCDDLADARSRAGRAGVADSSGKFSRRPWALHDLRPGRGSRAPSPVLIPSATRRDRKLPSHQYPRRRVAALRISSQQSV